MSLSKNEGNLSKCLVTVKNANGIQFVFANTVYECRQYICEIDEKLEMLLVYLLVI